jgi:hypothetical protein
MARPGKDALQEWMRALGVNGRDPETLEVMARFHSLLRELEQLEQLDLAGVTPLEVFPESGKSDA